MFVYSNKYYCFLKKKYIDPQLLIKDENICGFQLVQLVKFLMVE